MCSGRGVSGKGVIWCAASIAKNAEESLPPPNSSRSCSGEYTALLWYGPIASPSTSLVPTLVAMSNTPTEPPRTDTSSLVDTNSSVAEP
jgi:hypothetical protein